MGLFDRKRARPDADVGDRTEPPEPPRRAAGGEKKPGRASAAGSAPAAPAPVRYGVKHVMELMRALPVDENQVLVARVVRKTLESANISIDAIIQDAARAQDDARMRIETLNEAIAEMKQEIAVRRNHVAELQQHLKDVTRVKDLLTMAGESEGQSPQADDAGSTEMPQDDADAEDS